MTGAGLLGLKKRVPEIGTVFTTHATMLGRTLACSGMDIYTAMDHISPQREASAHNITAKCSMETASAREADCFTTVSEITAPEAKNFLGRTPDLITPNGLDIENIPDLAADRAPALKSREKLLAAAARFLHRELPANTRIMVISGRDEFHNKGIDLFLAALGRLNAEQGPEQTGPGLSLRPGRLHGPDPLPQERHGQARSGESAHRHPPAAERGLRSDPPGLRPPRPEESSPEPGPGHLHPGLSQRPRRLPQHDLLRGPRRVRSRGLPLLLRTLGVHAPGKRGLRRTDAHDRSGRLRPLGAAGGGRLQRDHPPQPSGTAGRGDHRPPLHDSSGIFSP